MLARRFPFCCVPSRTLAGPPTLSGPLEENSSDTKTDIFGVSRQELQRLLVAQPTYRASQVFRFLHAGRGRLWSDARQIPKELIGLLSGGKSDVIDRGTVQRRWVSRDGTCKFMIKVNPNRRVECKFQASISYGVAVS